MFAIPIVALVVGFLIGTTGVGGILLIPALAFLAGLSTHMAMATALFSFFLTGILGTWIYQKHGSINWGITIPVCIGAILSAYPGSLANAMVSCRILDICLGMIIVFAGFYALFPAKGNTLAYRPNDSRQKVMLLLIGFCTGFGSGLTGVGGPVLSVPMMVIIGFAPLTSIATSQVIQIAAAFSGSVGNFYNNFIDIQLGLLVGVVEMAGVLAGAHMAHKVSQKLLKKIISLVCIVVGVFIMARSLFYA